jgi:hypothetical protein
MPDRKLDEQPSDKDRLVTRPDPLPTAQDPAGPEARGGPADPKPDPNASQGNAGNAGDINRTV